MTALITKQNQTILELSKEFIEAMKKTQSGSESMDVLFDAMLEKEKTDPCDPKIIASIQNVNNTPLDASKCEVIVKNKIRISNVLLSWIAMQSSSIPEYIDTMVGMYAVVFYSTHKRKEELTLKWVSEQVGKGKLVGFRQFFPWVSVSKGEDGINIFYKLTPEELYQVK